MSFFIAINAQAYDDNDQAVIRQNINTISGNMVNQDYEPIINMISPKVLSQLGNSKEMPIEEVQRQLVDQSQKVGLIGVDVQLVLVRVHADFGGLLAF